MSADDLFSIEREYNEALRKLVAAKRKAFPVGSRWEFCVHGRILRGEVIAYGAEWFHGDAMALQVRNIKTGKRRLINIDGHPLPFQ